ncbi:MAG: hypothetical protein NT154_39805 [Verrucomicrobia bacterium]|nr:hypothetical protein [Verrucomicrobiota bacterium]
MARNLVRLANASLLVTLLASAFIEEQAAAAEKTSSDDAPYALVGAEYKGQVDAVIQPRIRGWMSLK